MLSFSWSGIRSDIELLIDEPLSSVSLCGLHSQMRNTEQLLKSTGLFAYECDSLKCLNAALKKYGPSALKRDFLVVKLRKNQETRVTRSNIDLVGMSGNVM